MVVLRSLKDILSIKIKPRHDSPSDQFSRLFMTKMLLIAAFIMGFEYFSDRISCLKPPSATELTGSFIHSACWISGLFIYKEMAENPRYMSQTIYRGIPQAMDHDGHYTFFSGYRDYRSGIEGKLCKVNDHKDTDNHLCRPMVRDYYMHYQWMPFYIGSIAVFFYLPYIFFRLVNADLISLSGLVRTAAATGGGGDADHIVRNYFNYKINSIGWLRFRVALNLLVKCCYVFVNLFGFFFTDYLLNGNYKDYGFEFVKWAHGGTDAVSHRDPRFRRKEGPGNVFVYFFVIHINPISAVGHYTYSTWKDDL